MKEQDKKLLLKDLCARLPYGVKVNYADKIYDVFGCSGDNLIIVLPFLSNLEAHPIETCKPYLRPMSSMTEEERFEYLDFLKSEIQDGGYVTENYVVKLENMPELIEWLNAHHFDYRGLIEKGLALEAPEGMYNFK